MPDRRYRALLIGNAVFRRDPQGLPKLHGPRADVDALSDALANPDTGLFAAEDIDTLIDRNLQNLREELHRFFIEDADRDDVLFLYYSGHGKLDLLGRLHLCASDTRVNALPVTALRYKEDIDAMIEASPATATVTILDCCHSGAFRGGDLKVKATGSGRCVITSASAGELAPDSLGPNGMSPFTTALVTGLRFAHADIHLTAQGLYEYVETELSPAGNASPQFYFDGEGSIALARRALRPPPVAEPLNETTEPVAAQPRRFQSTPAEKRELAGLPPLATPPEPEQAPAGLKLPEPRTLLWKLLNEAAETALSEDRDRGTNDLLGEVVEAAVQLDERWPRAVLKRLGDAPLKNAPLKQVVIEAMARGLTDKDIPGAIAFAREFAVSTPERTGAMIAIAAAMPEVEQVLAQGVLGDAAESCRRGRGPETLPTLLRLLEIESYAAGRTPPDADADLARVAVGLTQGNPGALRNFVATLRIRLEQVPDHAVRMQFQADAAVRMAKFDPRAAREFFYMGGHLLHEVSFEELPIREITQGGAAILGIDPSTGHRILEIAERRCRDQADWIEFFEALMDLLHASSAPAPGVAGHLTTMVERATDQVSDNELWRLSYASEALIASAPEAASRLLRLDPDEDRMRRHLIRLAKAVATVDVVAARDIATAAERLVLSIIDEAEETNELIELAQAFAGFDPEHAIRLLNSIPAGGFHRSYAIAKVAEVFASVYPDRIEMLIGALDPGDKPETLRTDVYTGVARVDPEWAMRLVDPLPDSPFKDSVIASAAETMAKTAPEHAAELAFEIRDESSRGDALAMLVRKFVDVDPERAAALARRIPDILACDHPRVTSLCTASRALIAQHPAQARELLVLAERTAGLRNDDGLKGLLLFRIAKVYIEIGSSSLRVSNLLKQAESCASASEEDHEENRTGLKAKLMIGWASIAPKRAELMLLALPAEWWVLRNSDLREAAIAMAPTDPRRAEQFAAMIGLKSELLRTQAALVEEFCQSAPARAERLALSMEPGENRTRALLAVAEAEVRRQSW